MRSGSILLIDPIILKPLIPGNHTKYITGKRKDSKKNQKINMETGHKIRQYKNKASTKNLRNKEQVGIIKAQVKS